MFLQSLRMTARDWRAGELRFLIVALVVAVSALSSVGFFIDRMRAGLERDAHQLLGADLLVNTDDPVPERWREEARRRGLLLAEFTTFQSMAQAGEGEDTQAKLAAVKAVSNGYPLRGQLTITTDPDAAGRALGSKTRGIPEPGTVWVDANLLPALPHRPADRRRTRQGSGLRQLRAARDALAAGPAGHQAGRPLRARGLPPAGGLQLAQRAGRRAGLRGLAA